MGDGKHQVVNGYYDGTTNVVEDGKLIAKTTDPQNGFDKNGNLKYVTIDLKDTSGKEFIDNHLNSGLDYFALAFRGLSNDFKSNGMPSGLSAVEQDVYRNRMMPVNNTPISQYNTSIPIIAPAEYIGNYTAGYVSGNNGLSLRLTRYGFDLYQGGAEPAVSANPQNLGWNAGNKNYLFNLYRDTKTTIPTK